ncbi:MAG: hypothetical protein KIH00_07370 [Lachnospiraceae bacterium]|nr:hypothetical protein [Lachnospiraceae bacterium]
MKIRKYRLIVSLLVGTIITASLMGCGSDKPAESEVVKSGDVVDGDVVDGDVVDMAAYEQLQADYDELLDYTIFLEQELLRAKGKYAETGAMMDEFVKANEAGNKIVLVEPMTIEDAEKSIEEKSE